jgi:hypothetical protein
MRFAYGPPTQSITSVHRFVSLVCATVLLGAPVLVAASDAFWQLEQGNVTVVAEGDTDTAAAAAALVFRLRSTARWLIAWTDDYHPPPTLVFALRPGTIRDVLQRPPPPSGADVDPAAAYGDVIVTPSLIVVLAPMQAQRGREFESLQYLYGRALVGAGTSRRWPECARTGVGMLIAAMQFSPPAHVYLDATKVRRLQPMDPTQFLAPPAGDMAAFSKNDRDSWGYSCYLFAYMMAYASVEDRQALSDMLAAVADGASLDDAVATRMHESLPQFTNRYRKFADDFEFYPRHFDINVDVPANAPAAAAATGMGREELRALLRKLCGSLSHCVPR